jgi:hypothetical protein
VVNIDQPLPGSEAHARFITAPPSATKCTACGSSIKLMAIEPSDIGHDLRTFACRNAKWFSGTSSKVP